MKRTTPLPEKAVIPKVINRRVGFTVNADPGRAVAVSGDFNAWIPGGRKMTDKKGNGQFTVTLNLAPGIYEYKFLIDNTWSLDPNCKEWVPNCFGTLNSVLHVE